MNSIIKRVKFKKNWLAFSDRSGFGDLKGRHGGQPLIQDFAVSRLKRTSDVSLMVSHNSEVNHLNILVLVVAIVDDTLWKPNEAFG